MLKNKLDIFGHSAIIGGMANDKSIHERFELIGWALDERLKRLFAATEAKVHGRGGVSLTARATGLSRQTIHQGIKDLSVLPSLPFFERTRIRKIGGGRKRLLVTDPKIIDKLDLLIEPVTDGMATPPLRWTCKSLRRLEQELNALGHTISYPKIGALLKGQHYNLTLSRPFMECNRHLDGNTQFAHINALATETLSAGNPVVFIETRKRIKSSKGMTQDALIEQHPELLETSHIEMLDMKHPTRKHLSDKEWITVYIDHYSTMFAIEFFRHWWHGMAQYIYPRATCLMIVGDALGCLGKHGMLWKKGLNHFATETGLTVHAYHFPKGTSKWNGVEQKIMSSYCVQQRGQPTIKHEAILHLIAESPLRPGRASPSDMKPMVYHGDLWMEDSVGDDGDIERDSIHGEWNYTIRRGCAG